MAQHRRPVFDAVRVARGGKEWTAADIALLDTALDRLGVPRDGAAPTTGLKDAAAFFAAIRKGKLLGPILSPEEVNGCDAILKACGDDGWPIGDTAYALATAYHETAGTMQPIKEYGGPTYLTRMYDVSGARPTLARKMGNTEPGDGIRYCGRGYVQLTWKANYARAGAALGIDLVAKPDLALQPDVAAEIMVRGMREGWFTGRDLDDDIPRAGPATLEEFIRSRDIINGKDKAQKIATEAVDFQHALTAGRWS